MKFHRLLAALLLLCSATGVWLIIVGLPGWLRLPAQPLTPSAAAADGVLRFAAIGDYGMGNQAESDVAALVKSWNPAFVITLGDNNYPNGEAATIDEQIGKDYADFIYPYTGAYGPGAAENRFFPALGNHDWNAIDCDGNGCTGPYFDYFSLPGNERYYDFVRGPVHFFVIDSDPREPDGRNAESAQASWLRKGLQASTARWKLVYMHHTIYSSSLHGSEPILQWPYRAWGAHAVLTGHDHTYERVMIDGFPYFVNGLGGAGIRTFGAPVPGSALRYNGDHGAMLIEVSDPALRFQFFNRNGDLIDDFVLDYAAPPTPTPTPQATVVLQAVADAFVYADAPATNYGSDLLLEIDGSPEKLAYLRFDLEGLSGAILRSAQLRVRVADVGSAESASTQDVHLTNGADWDEASIDFAGRPGLVSTALGGFGGGNRNDWLSASLGDGLRGVLGESITLAIRSDGSDGLDISSREGPNPPELVLAFDRPTPTPTPTPPAPGPSGSDVYLPEVNR